MLQNLASSLLVSWFNFVHDWGYAGIFLLMALESSVIPIPSEVVMPPAAFWASQGRLDFWLVVLAGTAGSYFGSAVSYLISGLVGRPIVTRFGKYFLVNAEKISMAEVWITRYGFAGIFTSRLLPVVRHLISIPAGILKMNFFKFSLATTAGAFSWCLVLSWFGQKAIGDRPDLMTSPQAIVAVCRDRLHWFVGAVIVLAAAYSLVVYFKKRPSANAQAL